MPGPNAQPSLIEVNTATGELRFGDRTMPCSIGRGGSCPAEAKREGDGCTPLGRWAIRCALLRPGRISLPGKLHIPWRWTRADDGWSDDPADPAYNRPVTHPHRYSAERLQRDDDAYTIILVLGHNDSPPYPGKGSAIFLHIWVPGTDGHPKPTEGCIAIDGAALAQILPLLSANAQIDIR